MSILPSQCRAARALLDVGSHGIGAPGRRFPRHYRRLENGGRTPSSSNLAAIRAELETSGVIFIDENGEGRGQAAEGVRAMKGVV
jgi:hypothetical protein